MLNLGREREITIVLDEYPYLLEHTPQLDSIIQRAFEPRNRLRTRARLHATLAGAASGHHTHRDLTSYVKIPGASLTPIVEALTSAELIDRIQDRRHSAGRRDTSARRQ